MGIGAAGLYLAWLLVTSNSEAVRVNFLIGQIELAVWQALGLAFAVGAATVGLYTLYLMARGRLVQRRYRKHLAGLETEVHQLRNLPLHADETPEASRDARDDLDLDFAPQPGGAKGTRG